MTNNDIITALASLINDADKKNKLSLDAAFEIFLNYSKSRVREATLYYYAKEYKLCKSICDSIGVTDTSELTKANYNIFVNIMIQKNYSNSTINKCTDLLKAILSVCNTLDYINYNP